jgi:hypothetical protein
LSTGAGLNRFVWDLRVPHPTALPYSYFGQLLEYTEYTMMDHAVPEDTPRLQPMGALVPPGTYELILTADGKSYRQKLRIVPDPRVHITPADFAAQFDLSRRVSELMNDSATAFETLTPVEKQLADRKKSLSANAPKELVDALANAEKQLDALKGGSRQTPGFGIINRDLGRYLEMLQGADSAPAESARTAFRVTCDAYTKDLAAANKLASETLPALNKLLAPEKLTPVAYTPPGTTPPPACAP